MSFATAKQRDQALEQENDGKPVVDASLLCTENGCSNRWSTTFYGRLCTQHEAALTGRRGIARPVPVPSRPPVAHWQDDRESA